MTDKIETAYRVLDESGKLVGDMPPNLSDATMLEWYRTMWLTRFFSHKAIAFQRQGRGTTWLSSQGQEAAAVGLATALRAEDWLTASPREVGGYFQKGVPPAAIAYFTRGYPPPPQLTAPDGQDRRCLPLTIVIGTQSLHSVGLARAAQIKGSGEIVVCSCGDGASSEGDFSEALNFAGVYRLPLVFVVVNNGWAISVPRSNQTATAQIASRGVGFGMPGRLVDGNDIVAMYAVMKEATERARGGGGPTLVEAVTYRLGAHSTADDPTRYRPPEELALWEARDPLGRLGHFLRERGTLDETGHRQIIEEAEAFIADQFRLAHEYPAPPADAFFTNVYAALTPRLTAQRESFRQAARPNG